MQTSGYAKANRICTKNNMCPLPMVGDIHEIRINWVKLRKHKKECLKLILKTWSLISLTISNILGQYLCHMKYKTPFMRSNHNINSNHAFLALSI